MFKLDPESEAAQLLEKFVFEVATRRIDGALANETMQERIDADTERIGHAQQIKTPEISTTV